ncbi:hypothetical protein HSX11_01705 [Oxalobacteraceae bacterium]|nr:hypothetical protein [Oxalobacteraceae bacterium]
MTFHVDLSELDGLRARIESFGVAVKENVAMRGVAGMAKVVYDEARFYAPISEKAHVFYGRNSVRTGVKYTFQPGNLKSAIYRTYSPELSNANHKVYRVSWNHRKAPYGHMVEFGTSHAPAFPFLGRALSAIPRAIAAGKFEMTEAMLEITRQA